MPTRRESVRLFLHAQSDRHNAPDLLELFLSHPGLESQVNVAQGDGEPLEAFRDDERSQGFTNGVSSWTAFRIDDRRRADLPQPWPLDLHADAIGASGWDWEKKVSRWVGFDFDSIAGHAAGVGISDDDLDRVRQAACALDWIEVRRSTGGNGLHLYVMFDEPVPAVTRRDHIANAHDVLRLMSDAIGFDFSDKVDACGSNLWIWSRRATPENQGLAIIKAAVRTLRGSEIPPREPITTANTTATGPEAAELGAQHREDIRRMQAAGFVAAWNGERLDAHTKGFETLGRPGYRTTSPATDPQTPNCFAFPRDDNGWTINRFGTKPEAEADGWTFNKGGFAMYRLPPPATISMLPKPLAASDLMSRYKHPRETIIEGLAQAGDVVNVVAPPKLKKSFLAMLLAISVALGLPFLGRATKRGRVLLIDNELKRDNLAARLRDMAKALGLAGIENLEVIPLRGALATLETIRGELVREQGRYTVVIIDALYKTLKDIDENSNSDMTRAYSMLDEIAEKHGCALVVVHHASKGAQHAKSVADMGSGAGAQSRSADCHIVLREHAEPDTVVMQAIVRSQKPIEPACLTFDYPLWKLAPEKSPASLAVAGKKSQPTLQEFVALVSEEPVAKTAEVERVRRMLDTTKVAATLLYDEAVAQGLVRVLDRKGPRFPVRIQRTPAAKLAA